uniref:Uncharacterized protein n=1 Tax=Ditylum brightwellii TaxID=49249 RepID=A0A7S4VAX4_9STRA
MSDRTDAPGNQSVSSSSSGSLEQEMPVEAQSTNDPPLMSILKKGRGPDTIEERLVANRSDNDEDEILENPNGGCDDDSGSFGSSIVDVDDIKASTTSGPRVKFASSTSDGPIPPPSSFDDAKTKTKEELLAMVSDLREGLLKVTVDRTSERVLRKKKEKNMIKMAKELSMRSADLIEKEKQITELQSTNTDLAGRLRSTKQQLENLSENHRQEANDRHAEIAALQVRYRESCAAHDSLVAQLNSSNALQCDELRRRALTAELESDKLRVELARLGMKGNPEKAGDAVKKTIKDSGAGAKFDTKTRDAAKIAEIRRESRERFWQDGKRYMFGLLLVS